MFAYLIICSVNGKGYVGITTRTIETRWAEHLLNTKRTTALKRAIKKYGVEAFSVRVLASAETEEKLKQLEIQYIADLKTHTTQHGYNMTWGGDGVIGYVFTDAAKTKTQAGVKRSLQKPEVLLQHIETLNQHRPTPEETSTIMKRKWADPEWRAKQATSIKMALNRPEVKHKLQIAQQKAQRDPVVRKRHSNAMKVSAKAQAHLKKLNDNPANHWWLRKDKVEKVRDKLRIAGNRPETRKRHAEVTRQMWSDPKRRAELIQKIGAAKRTPEARQAASDKSKAAWAIRKTKKKDTPTTP